jgi:hypothetical protein
MITAAPVAEAELQQDAGNVRLDGVLVDEKGGRDLGVGLAARDLTEHFGFAFGECAEVGVGPSGGAVGELLDQSARHRRREERPTVGDHPDGHG